MIPLVRVEYRPAAVGSAELEPMPQTSAQAVMDDHGEIGDGATNAHHVSAENGEDYIMKGRAFIPSHPTVAANEWIAARLAEALGLPVLPSQVLEMNGELFFGSSWMPKGATWHPQIDRNLFSRCENQDRAHALVVLDTWLLNQDRHARNLIVRVVGGKRHFLMLNDHSHLLVSPLGPKRMEDLMGCLDHLPGRFVRLPFIKDHVAKVTLLRDALDRVEQLTDAQIKRAIDATPVEFLAGKDRTTYREFLLRRRPMLRELFNADPSAFPRLKGATV